MTYLFVLMFKVCYQLLKTVYLHGNDRMNTFMW